MDSCENGTAIVLQDLTERELQEGERHMSYKIGIFFPLFVFGNERRWDIGKWGKYYAAPQSLFPPMSQMPMFPFSGTYSNFKIKSCGKIHLQSKYCVSQVHSVREASTNAVIHGLFSFCSSKYFIL